eukprot:6249165-Prymnesium_polylepis.1
MEEMAGKPFSNRLPVLFCVFCFKDGTMGLQVRRRRVGASASPRSFGQEKAARLGADAYIWRCLSQAILWILAAP